MYEAHSLLYIIMLYTQFTSVQECLPGIKKTTTTQIGIKETS